MRGDSGGLYKGSSWSRACASSKDLRNFGGGENDPSTEFSNDMVVLLCYCSDANVGRRDMDLASLVELMYVFG
jgi:hypothetical protein